MLHCFYHSADLDGRCSGAIVKYRFPEAVMHPINYGDEFPWELFTDTPRQTVYMVDFALQPFMDMMQLAKICNLHWIDHHLSAIKEYNSLNIGGRLEYTIQGLRDTRKAACELTWGYLFPYNPVPLAVKLLSLYDSWTFQGHELEDMVLPFQMRLRMEDTDPVGLNALLAWSKLFASTSIDTLIKEGRLLLRYDEAQKAKYAKTYAFETTLIRPVGKECGEGIGAEYHYKAIAVNLGHTNSKVFDSVWRKECPYCDMEVPFVCRQCNGTGYLEPYDLMITFVRRPDKLWNVSLYSTKETINCGAIAKSFGGGGHKGAAGFQCKDLPFEI